MTDVSHVITTLLMIGGQYCLLALAFAFVWWSSRTFFVAGAALIPAAGAVMFTLVSAKGMGLVPAAIVAVLASVGLAAIIETGVMRPMARWRRGSSRGGLTESAVLDSSIVSFALYLLLVNALQWAVRWETVKIPGEELCPAWHEAFEVVHEPACQPPRLHVPFYLITIGAAGYTMCFQQLGYPVHSSSHYMLCSVFSLPPRIFLAGTGPRATACSTSR